jgi:hypothetical protein
MQCRPWAAPIAPYRQAPKLKGTAAAPAANGPTANGTAAAAKPARASNGCAAASGADDATASDGGAGRGPSSAFAAAEGGSGATPARQGRCGAGAARVRVQHAAGWAVLGVPHRMAHCHGLHNMHTRHAAPGNDETHWALNTVIDTARGLRNPAI